MNTPGELPHPAPTSIPTPVTTGRRPRSLLLPTVLIGLGVVWLLGNVGLPTWAVWAALLRLWPLLLIAWGVEVLLRPTTSSGHVLLIAAVLAALGLGTWWVVQQGNVGAGLTSHALSVPLPSGAQRAEVQLQAGVGGLRLTGGAGATLLSGSVQTLPGERLTRENRLDGATAFVRLAAEGSTVLPNVFGPASSGPLWTLRLNDTLPLALSVETGVGRTDLDLRALRVETLTLHAGVGNSTLTLPARGHVQATVTGGVGELTLRLPADLAARVDVQAGLGAVRTIGAFGRDGSAYLTPGFAASENRAEVSVQGGVGGVVIERLP